ncbi:MAG TPA: hypothetical protein VN843_20375, partial [Anaerolineales bacterium]|nr:hypothetical protein [Anaerolineales bacterium]
SVLFINHLAGYLFGYESKLDKRLKGRLLAAYRDRESDVYFIVETQDALSVPFLCIINFQSHEVPFDYPSVDKYARQIIRVLREQPVLAHCRRVATRLFGRSGLDVGESLETMISAFSSEIRITGKPGSLEEIQFVEYDDKVAVRSEQRLAQLLEDGTIVSGKLPHLNLSQSDAVVAEDENRFESLARRPIFVAMPYAKEFDNIYFFGIKGPVEAHGRKCERVDQEHFTGDIIKQIKDRIGACEIVIGDLTGQNANVFYEIGYAEGLGKRVLLLTQDENPPFDLKTQRQIRYQPIDIRGLADTVKAELDHLLPKPSSSTDYTD